MAAHPAKELPHLPNKSGLDIATQILGEWGIEVDVATARIDAKRDYRVQYGETDHAFVCRMLQEAGIAYYFRVDEWGTRLVLSHAPQSGPRRDAAIAFRDNPTKADRDHITKLRIGQQVHPARLRHPPAPELLARRRLERRRGGHRIVPRGVRLEHIIGAAATIS